MKIKSAIFDMDGTLVDSLMIWEVIWSSFGKKYKNDAAFVPSAEDDKKVRTMTLKDAMELIHRNYGLSNSGSELLSEANRILFDFSLEQVPLSGWQLKDVTFDLHHSEYAEGNIMTEYEEKFSSMGNPIFRLVAYR